MVPVEIPSAGAPDTLRLAEGALRRKSCGASANETRRDQAFRDLFGGVWIPRRCPCGPPQSSGGPERSPAVQRGYVLPGTFVAAGVAMDLAVDRGGTEAANTLRLASAYPGCRVSRLREPAQARLGAPRSGSHQSLVAEAGLPQDCRCLQPTLRRVEADDGQQVVRCQRAGHEPPRDCKDATRHETPHPASAAAQPHLGARSVHDDRSDGAAALRAWRTLT